MFKECRGINPWSRERVKGDYVEVAEEEVKLRIGDDGLRAKFYRKVLETDVKRVETGRHFAYADGYDGAKVYRYVLADGTSWLEIVQEHVTDELYYYLCLQDPDGNIVPESRWTPEQIAMLQDQAEVPKEVDGR
ncbi:MAG: hypothetical protein ABIB97_05355 [Patescibacteria group bacterium]